MAVAATLRAVLGLDDSDYKRGLKESERATAASTKEIEAQFAKVGAAVGVAIAAGVAAIGKALNDAINRADEFNKLSQKIGLGVEALSSFSLAADLADVSAGKLQSALTRLNKDIASAAGGGELAAKKFETIGVAIRNQDGTLRSTGDVFRDLAERFATFEDGPAKAALAVQLFGKAGADLLPLLNAGAAGLDDAAEKARALGLVIGQDTAQQSEVFNDNLTLLGKTVDGFGNTLAAEVIPALAGFSTSAVDAAVDGGGLTSAAKAIGEEFRAFLRDIVGVQTQFQILGAEVANAVAFLTDLAESAGTVGNILIVTFESVGLAAGGNLAEAERGFRAVSSAIEGLATKAAIDAAARAGVLSDSITAIQEEAAEKIAKINGELARSGPAADQAADGFKKVPAPVINLTTATTKLEKATKTARVELTEAQKAAKAWGEGIERLVRSLEDAAIDKQAADFVQLSLAIDEAVAKGDEEAVERYTRALLLLGKEMDGVAEETKKAADELDEFEQINKRAAENFKSIWEGVTRDVASAFADLFSGAGGGIEGFLNSLAGANQRRVGATLDNAFNTGIDTLRAGGGPEEALAAFSDAGGFAAVGEAVALQAGAYLGGGGANAQIGAQIGSLIGSIFGPIGSIIGSILGGLAGGAFDDVPSLRVIGSDVIGTRGNQNVARRFDTALGEFALSGVDAVDGAALQQIQEALQQFDQTIADIADTIPGQTEKIKDALASINQQFDEEELTPDEIISRRLGVIVGTFEARVQDYVNAVDGAQAQTERLARAVELLSAAEEGLFPEGLGTSVENASLQAQRAQQRAGAALEELGFSADTTAAQLEAAFNRGEGLTIEQIEAYFETAQAVREATAAVRAYEEAIEAQRQAVQSYNDFIAGFREEAFGLNDFQRGLRGIQRATRDATEQANRLARAAGLQAAREEDLAIIQIASARRVAAAVRELEQASRGIVAQLYPAADAAGQLAAAGQTAAQAIGGVAGDLNDATRGLRQFADDLLIGENSPLQGRDRLAKALALLEQASAAGDAGRVQQLASQTLGIGRDVFASGRDFADLFARVEGIVRSTVAVDTGGGGPGGGVDIGTAAEQPALTAGQRFELAQDLAQNVADIASVTGESVAEIAARLGFTVEQLAEDLGISAEDIDKLIEKLKPDPAADALALAENFGTVTEALDAQTEALVEATEEVTDTINENAEEQREIDRQNGERLGDIVQKLDALIDAVRESGGERSTRPPAVSF